MVLAAGGAFDPEGPVARTIADLWWVLLALGTLSFVIFFAVLAVGLTRGRGSAEDFPGESAHRLILLGGVALPAVVLSIVMVLTVLAMIDTPDDAGPEALTIEVIGHQWWWEFRYPEEGIVTANEVHFPVGRPIEFLLTTGDVIHSFWIPQLGGKKDLLPEDVNTLILEADKPGVYRSQCAEFCGLQHAKMGFVAVVEPRREFSEWVRRHQRAATPPQSAAARTGYDVFLTSGCATCHTIRGTQASGEVGPDLTHLASRRTLAAATLPNTADALRRWISDPHAIKDGVEMPDVEIPEAELAALVEYLRGLE